MGVVGNYDCPIWPCRYSYRPDPFTVRNTPTVRLQESIRSFLMGHLAGDHGINSVDELKLVIKNQPSDQERLAEMLMGE